MFRLTLAVLLVAASTSALRRSGPLPGRLALKGQPMEDEARIVGGSEATTGQFPYQLSFQQDAFLGGQYHFCGAEIYDESTVITAAHCCAAVSLGDNPNIIAGQLDQSINNDEMQTVAVAQIIQNDDYNRFTFENDICVLKLAGSLEMNDLVAPVTMPTQGQEFDVPGTAIVSGWGTLTSGGVSPNVLNYVEVPLVTDEDCGDANSYGSDYVPESMICAGAEGLDSCQGDSGGPMTCDDGILCGIVSWGYGCAVANKPGVYTRASAYVDWVASQ